MIVTIVTVVVSQKTVAVTDTAVLFSARVRRLLKACQTKFLAAGIS